MGTVVSNLKAHFGVDTTDFKHGLKDGEKALNEFKEAGSEQISEFAGMFGVNMSGVMNAVSLASKSFSFLTKSIDAAKESEKALSVMSVILDSVLISTGIGALVVLLGSVAAYFTKSAEGGAKFAKILAQVKAVFNDVIERFVIFGKGITDFASGKFKQGWEEMKGAFKGMGEEIREDVKAAGELAEESEKLERREIALIVSASARKAKAAELRKEAKEETEDNKKKLSLLQEAYKITKEVYNDEIRLEADRLNLMKEKLKLQTTDPTLEQQKEIAEQQAKVNGLIEEQQLGLKGIDREMKTVNEEVKKEFALFNSFSNIKMPKMMDKKGLEVINQSLKDLHHSYVQLKEDTGALFQVMDQVGVEAAETMKSAFLDLSLSVSDFLGSLLNGTANIGNFGATVAQIFGKMLQTIGTAMIAAGLAKLKFDALITVFGGAPGIIAAGIAVAAFGAALSGSVGSAMKSSGSSSASVGAASSGVVWDTRTINTQVPKLQITGTLVAKGNDLVYIFNQENNRKTLAT